MPEPPEELLAAVRDQAEARVRMDVQGYAKYLIPEAVESLRPSFPDTTPRLTAYEIEKHERRGVDHVFEVRYAARDRSFVIRSRWRQLGDGWVVVSAELTGGGKRPGIVSRLLGSLRRALGR